MTDVGTKAALSQAEQTATSIKPGMYTVVEALSQHSQIKTDSILLCKRERVWREDSSASHWYPAPTFFIVEHTISKERKPT